MADDEIMRRLTNLGKKRASVAARAASGDQHPNAEARDAGAHAQAWDADDARMLAAMRRYARRLGMDVDAGAGPYPVLVGRDGRRLVWPYRG